MPSKLIKQFNNKEIITRMKKILLSVALVAMSVFSMSASSFKIEVNDVEVKNGDVIEMSELVQGTLGMAIYPHLVLTNTTSSEVKAEIEAGFLEVAQPETTTGQAASMCQFCFNGVCIAPPSAANEFVTIDMSFSPNQSYSGQEAHVEYMPAYEGSSWWDVQKFYAGVSVLQFTLRNKNDNSDAITFTFKFNYTGENAIDGIEADNAAVEYYNLQGVKVANPEKGGMYIVRRGAKVSKEIVR